MAKRPTSGGPIEALKKRAKQLLNRVQSGDADAFTIARLHPACRGGVSREAFSLADALLVIARQEGYTSWPKLKAAAEQSGVIPMEIKFTGIGMRIYVLREHFAAAAEFYEKVLGLKLTFRSDAYPVATFEFGFGPRLVLEVYEPNDDPRDEEQARPRFTGITLSVKDVEKTYEHLKAQGVPFLEPPEKMDWGGIMAHFRDPGGNTLTIIQMPGARN